MKQAKRRYISTQKHTLERFGRTHAPTRGCFQPPTSILPTRAHYQRQTHHPTGEWRRVVRASEPKIRRRTQSPGRYAGNGIVLSRTPLRRIHAKHYFVCPSSLG